jgi:AraC family transcriptional regulator, regulatory protein of adaptative response / methylated-DNA-[protein]-cysteine methyltransferase
MDATSILTEATAEKIRGGGAGMKIRWGVSESPFGKMFLAESSRGITHLSFFNGDEINSLEKLRRDFPKADLVRDDGFSGKMMKRIFTGKAEELRLHVNGTPFQEKVWQALLDIPPGSVSTYGKIAAHLGMPGASRAVGGAVGANRIAFLIPCHRVIRADGGLGGFRWGTERKRAMLAAEFTPR